MEQKEKEKLIRERLAFPEGFLNQITMKDSCKELDFSKEHQRFDMSGYESTTGSNTIHNQKIINLFADLGIYDYTDFLAIDFDRGTGNIYLKYINEEEVTTINVTGEGTRQIIYTLLEATIWSGKPKRKRS